MFAYRENNQTFMDIEYEGTLLIRKSVDDMIKFFDSKVIKEEKIKQIC